MNGIHPTAKIHPSAQIHPTAFVGAGAVIERGAVVSKNATINRGAVIERGATVSEGTEVGCGSTIRAGATVPVSVTIMDGTTFPDTPAWEITPTRWFSFLDVGAEALVLIVDAKSELAVEAQALLDAQDPGGPPGAVYAWFQNARDLHKAHLAELQTQFTPEEWARHVAAARARFDQEESHCDSPR